MCKCNPSVRTPYCGKLDCVPPKKEPKHLTLTPKQMFEAICSLSPASIGLDANGRWFVNQNGAEIRRKGLRTSIAGRGDTPEEAIDDHWSRLTNVADDGELLVSGNRFRWNGFMWRMEN